MHTKLLSRPLRWCAGPGQVFRVEVYATMAIAGIFFRNKMEMEASKPRARRKFVNSPYKRTGLSVQTCCAPRDSLLVARRTASPYNTDDPAYCPFALNEIIFFLFSFVVPELACHRKVWARAFYCPEMRASHSRHGWSYGTLNVEKEGPNGRNFGEHWTSQF